MYFLHRERPDQPLKSLVSPHRKSEKVLTGIWFLSKVPGFVVDLPLSSNFLFSLASSLSMVAGLISKSFFLVSSSSFSSPNPSRIGMISAKAWMKSFTTDAVADDPDLL